jgi:hypothetical protein
LLEALLRVQLLEDPLQLLLVKLQGSLLNLPAGLALLEGMAGSPPGSAALPPGLVVPLQPLLAKLGLLSLLLQLGHLVVEVLLLLLNLAF